MDIEMLGRLADSAEERAHRCFEEWDKEMGEYDGDPTCVPRSASTHLNDYFYWIGHAVAYKGVIAALEIQAVVDDEMDAEPTCP